MKPTLLQSRSSDRQKDGREIETYTRLSALISSGLNTHGGDTDRFRERERERAKVTKIKVNSNSKCPHFANDEDEDWRYTP